MPNPSKRRNKDYAFRPDEEESIDIDEPCELGGSNAFANPQEYLIAALNAGMKDAVEPLGKDDDLVPVLLEELPAPALPPDRVCPGVLLLTAQAISGRPSFTPGLAALPMTDGVHPPPYGHPLAGGGQCPSVGGHGHVRCGWEHEADAMLVQPPQIGARQKAAIKDHLMQAGVAGQVGACLCDYGPQGKRFMRLDGGHRHRQGNLGGRVDQDDHLPAIARHLDLAHSTPLSRHLPLPGDVATALIRRRGLQIGAIHHPGHLSLKDAGLGHGPDDAVEQALQCPQVQLHEIIRQSLWADRASRARPLPLGGAALAHAVPHLVGIEPHQAHARFVAEQQLRQGMHARDAKQALQAVEQRILHHRHQLPLDPLASDVPQHSRWPPTPGERESTHRARPPYPKGRPRPPTPCGIAAAPRVYHPAGRPAHTTARPGSRCSLPALVAWSTALSCGLLL